MNHMKAITKKLGLRLGESFKVPLKGEEDTTRYRLTDLGLQIWDSINKEWVDSCWKPSITDLLTGKYQIKKVTFDPYFTDGIYYTIFWNKFYPKPKVFKTTYSENPDKYLLRNTLGNCFETQEEAEEQVQAVVLKWSELGIDGDLLNGRAIWKKYKSSLSKVGGKNE